MCRCVLFYTDDESLPLMIMSFLPRTSSVSCFLLMLLPLSFSFSQVSLLFFFSLSLSLSHAHLQPMKGGMSSSLAEVVSPDQIAKMEAALHADIGVLTHSKGHQRELNDKVTSSHQRFLKLSSLVTTKIKSFSIWLK